MLAVLPELAGRRFDEEDEELLEVEDEEEEDFFFDDDELPFVEEDDLLLVAFSGFPSFPSLAGDILRLKALGLFVVTLVSSKVSLLLLLLVVAFLLAEWLAPGARTTICGAFALSPL